MNNVKVLNVISAEKSKTWYTANAAELFMFSKKAMIAPSDGVVEAFAPVYERLLDTLSLGDEGVELTGLASDVYQWLSDTIRDSLATGMATPGTLANLTALVKASPSRIDPFANGLMKVFNRLVKDHISPAAMQTQNTPAQVPGQVLTPAQAAAQTQSRAAEPAHQTVQKIFSVLEICRLSVGHFGENRKQFLSGLVLLVSSSQNADIRRRILSLTKEWVLGRPIVNPTPKEKASLMQKMQVWQKFNDPIYRDYLNLVFDVYSTPSMARSDLTVRLETSFVLGCRLDDMALRTRFLDLFSENVPKVIGTRLSYLIGGQSWESMGEFNWAYVVLDMIFGAANGEAILTPAINSLSTLATTELRVKDILQPMRHLLFYSSIAMHQTFITIFPQVWQGLARKEQADITASLVHVLTKDWRHDLPRPNVMQSLLGGIQRCTPSIAIPPHVLKYLVKIYHAWYEGLEILQHAVEQGREDDDAIRDSNQDALAELYAELCEDDYFYGLWRRRCLYEETNAALSYEQNGFFHFAQPLYEIAQMKARQNIYPMSESEYYIWEDHWMLCTEKLLQWDILQDVASGEGNPDLALECAWRTLQTWNSENVVVATYMNQAQDPVTPRRLLFKAYFTLNTMAYTAREQLQAAAQAASQGGPTGLQPQVKLDIDAASEFSKVVDEANQITLRKWFMLPENLTMAHVPLLAQFQQVVELKEASLLMTTLLATTRENLNEKAHEAKSIFHHWRERLPQPHDDIGLWNDLVSWRQHVFHAVNKFYLPLLTEAPAQSTASTHAHRGHHESAWIINRFAHVARKHGLLQVCQNSLADIYKLPNIEISEAFLKLREQARCHYEKPNELYQGLEVINNTNLMYFTAPQKAEFYAMKGLFLHKMNRQEDANAAFGQAVQLDFSMPKAWALWGVYSDDMHTANPTDFSLAANAVSCYLQAASLYKSSKSRPLLNRILWLLSMDDQQQTVGRMWDTYKGEHVYWYWITFIPQLLMSLSQREGRFAHQVLYNIAKMFPQVTYHAAFERIVTYVTFLGPLLSPP
jgi:transformation/transcription domain-associated protein